MAASAIRRRRMGSHEHTVTRPAAASPAGTGIRYIVVGFASILAVGTLFLTLPISSADGEFTNPLDALFTAISAICVTGLVVFDTQTQWNFFGELVIIVLIQVGGLGYMVGTAFATWILGRRLGIRDRHLLRQYYGAPSMGETLNFARNIALFAFAFEAAGAIALYVIFLADGESALRSVWLSIFHSISAFNNAGFNVTGNDLFDYRANTPMLLTIAGLVIVGGVGALPIFAWWQFRRFGRLPLDYRIIFVATAALLLVGTLFVLTNEWSNSESLGSVDPAHRPVIAFFEASMVRTAGFSAIDTNLFHDETLLFKAGLMFIGGASGSTAGGIKVGTFSVLFLVLLASLRRREQTTAFGRVIPHEVTYRALAVALTFLATALVVAGILAQLNDFSFIRVLFEAISALGTVGESTGITPELGTASRIVLMAAMLAGRLGPLLLVLYMTRPEPQTPYRYPREGVRIG